jgi:hypothetical protein
MAGTVVAVGVLVVLVSVLPLSCSRNEYECLDDRFGVEPEHR